MPSMQQAFNTLLQRLDTYGWEDETERTSVILIKDMLARYPDIWLQSCEAGHITGSGLILDRVNDKVLLMYHRKLQYWLQMGGHGEDEFDPAQTALREANEESGLTDLKFYPDSASPMFIDVDAHIIPAHHDKPEHYHLDFRYLFFTRSPEKIQRLKTEAKDLQWYSFSEIPALQLKPATLRLIKKAEKLLHSSH